MLGLPSATTGRVMVAVAALLVAACGSDPDDSASGAAGTASAAATADDLSGHTFLSTEVTGETLAEGARLTLAFEDGNVAVLGGCNTLTGGYEVVDGVLQVPQVAQTNMACEDDLQRQDAWVSEMLAAGPTVSLEGDVLTLATDDITIVFGDREAVATANPLDGSAWAIDSLEDADGTTDAPDGATLIFEGDQVIVATGCNRGFADVEVTDATVTVGPMGMTRMACEDDLAEWETALTLFLEGELGYELTDDSLVLTRDDTTLTLSPV